MLWKRAYLALSVILLVLVSFSCQLFENDVSDFMELYTETAAIDNHEINVDYYFDLQNRLCISSEEDAEIQFFMRNPKRYNLIPSVTFDELNQEINRD